MFFLASHFFGTEDAYTRTNFRKRSSSMLHIFLYIAYFGLTSLLLFSCGLTQKNDSKAPNEEQAFTQGELPASISIIGDSISTGVLAETKFGTMPEQSFFRQVMQVWLQGTDDLNPEEEFSRPDLAAATTTAEFGLRAAIAKLEGLDVQQVEYFSVAQFGAKTTDIDSMLGQLNEAYQNAERQDYHSQFVLFMLGANDFCANLDPLEFRINFEDALTKTVQRHQNSTILVAYLPPIYQLPSFEYEYGLKIFDSDQLDLVTCRDFQENSCQPIFTEDAASRYQAFNDAIREIVASYKHADSANRLLTTEAMLTWELTEEELSVDCFHPSAQGQVRIGEFFHEAIQNSLSP